MPVRSWRFRIGHIVENIERVMGFVQGMSFDEFRADEKTTFAVVTGFSIIGEAARLVPDEVKQANLDVPWSRMMRMRNVLVHEYDRIDLGIVWATIQQDLPGLVPRLHQLLQDSTDTEEP